MKRRSFVNKTLAASALAGFGGLSLKSCLVNSKKHITILHTNDVHSHIEAFSSAHASFPNMGGVIARAELIRQIRSENPNTLLLDAGDIFQGTPYFNFYGGELEFKLMSKLGYDAATIGNHDFDNGVDGLLAQLPNADFKLLSANYDFINTVLDGFVETHQIYIVDDIRIGVFGLGIQLAGLVPKDLYKETRYLNPTEIAQDMGRRLKEDEDCDLVICLSHLGFEYTSDEQRASDVQLCSATDYIDLIIGGHTHTFLEKPIIRKNRRGERVLINQVGCYGVNLGRIDFYFDSAAGQDSGGINIVV